MDLDTNTADNIIAELDAILATATESSMESNQAVREKRLPSLKPRPTIKPLSSLPNPAAPIPTAKAHILVVDDCRDYQEILFFILKMKGYFVELADNGAQGLKKARKKQPDLILLDFNMPELNGYEFIQEIRGDYELRKTPIIMFTGARNREELRRMDLNIQDFLDKPVSNAILLSSIAQVLKKAKGGNLSRRTDFRPKKN
jgi:CheY-like chemotaxis protein